MIALDNVCLNVTPRTLCRAVATDRLLTSDDRIITPKAVTVNTNTTAFYSAPQSLVVTHDLIGGRPCHIAVSVMLTTYCDKMIRIALYDDTTNTYLGMFRYIGFGWNCKSKVAHFQYTQPDDGAFSVRADFQIFTSPTYNSDAKLVLAVFP
jgi:hypothetical protein